MKENAEAKRKKRRRNKKKKKTGADSMSEVSNNDQSELDESIDRDSRSNSAKTRPGTNSRKLLTQDFTPLKEKIPDDFFDDQDSSEDEGMPDYKIGGYHPVNVGEILMDRYIII